LFRLLICSRVSVKKRSRYWDMSIACPELLKQDYLAACWTIWAEVKI
jgi:hypothetical protein